MAGQMSTKEKCLPTEKYFVINVLLSGACWILLLKAVGELRLINTDLQPLKLDVIVLLQTLLRGLKDFTEAERILRLCLPQ